MPLTPTVGEGYDPDVVASIQRRPPSLDVIPQDQEEDEQGDYSDAQHEGHSCVYVHRPSDAGSLAQGDEHMYLQGAAADAGTCGCQHTRYSRNLQHSRRALSEDSRDTEVCNIKAQHKPFGPHIDSSFHEYL